MKVCMISSDFSFEPLGGRSVTLGRMMEGITDRFPDTEFTVISGKGEKAVEKRGNITAYRLRSFERSAIRLIRRLDERIDFDIIHGFDIFPDGHLAVLIASSLSKKSVVGIREVYILKAGRLMLKKIAGMADHVVAVDRTSMEVFRRITGRRKDVSFIHNSINPRNPQGRKARWGKEQKSTGFLIGNVSYLGDVRKVKGWEYLLKAFGMIKGKIPGSRLVLIGSSDTGETGKISTSIRGMGLEGDVILKGVLSHDEVLREMSEFDVYVSPSVFEGMPNAILEAMGQGLPTIAARSGGVPEIITDGVNGLLVKEFSPEEIYEKVVSLYNRRDEMERLGRNAHEIVERDFSPEKEALRWKELYDSIISDARVKKKKERGLG